MALEDVALFDLNFLDEKSGLVELVIMRSVGNSRVNEVCQWVAGLLVYVGKNGESLRYPLPPDHVGYDADLAWRDAIIFVGCGDHGSVLFLCAAFRGGSFGG